MGYILALALPLSQYASNAVDKSQNTCYLLTMSKAMPVIFKPEVELSVVLPDPSALITSMLYVFPVMKYMLPPTGSATKSYTQSPVQKMNVR